MGRRIKLSVIVFTLTNFQVGIIVKQEIKLFCARRFRADGLGALRTSIGNFAYVAQIISPVLYRETMPVKLSGYHSGFAPERSDLVLRLSFSARILGASGRISWWHRQHPDS